MSFAGTVAWMAPEVIRNEPCSEKVDIWSYGVVIWELLTCEIPYRDVDSSAIIWGVGNNSLHLPIPSTCPQGFKYLVNICWNVKPRNRPSFKIILKLLEEAAKDLLKTEDEQYFKTQESWKEEIRTHMLKMASNGSDIHKIEQDLIKKRKDEWKHAQDIKLIYERKLERTQTLFTQVKTSLMYLQEREREIAEREKQQQQQLKLPYKICKSTVFRKSGDKYNRRRANQSIPTSPDHLPSTPSPDSPIVSIMSIIH